MASSRAGVRVFMLAIVASQGYTANARLGEP